MKKDINIIVKKSKKSIKKLKGKVSTMNWKIEDIEEQLAERWRDRIQTRKSLIIAHIQIAVQWIIIISMIVFLIWNRTVFN